MSKYLGIDYGTKRVGLALTDDLKIVASPLETIDTAKIIDHLKKLIVKENVELIVLGEPKYLDGNISETTKKVYKFQEELKKAFPTLPIHLEDEMFTSKMASDTLISAGIKKSKRKDKSLLDKVSAALILKSYMDKL
ncbi:MAG: Holliday junction resolvase RuvX [Chitinophagales bacterium]